MILGWFQALQWNIQSMHVRVVLSKERVRIGSVLLYGESEVNIFRKNR